LVALWLPWYHFEPHNFLVLFGHVELLRRSVSAWQQFAVLDVVLAVVGGYAIALGVAGLWGWTPGRLLFAEGLLLVGVAVVLWAILRAPAFPLGANELMIVYSIQYGALVALGGAILAVLGLACLGGPLSRERIRSLLRQLTVPTTARIIAWPLLSVIWAFTVPGIVVSGDLFATLGVRGIVYLIVLLALLLMARTTLRRWRQSHTRTGPAASG
jgi:hypothetical protein